MKNSNLKYHLSVLKYRAKNHRNYHSISLKVGGSHVKPRFYVEEESTLFKDVSIKLNQCKYNPPFEQQEVGNIKFKLLLIMDSGPKHIEQY